MRKPINIPSYSGPDRRHESQALPVLLLIILVALGVVLIAGLVQISNQNDTNKTLADNQQLLNGFANESSTLQESNCERQNDSRHQTIEFMLLQARKDIALANADTEPTELRAIRLSYANKERAQAAGIADSQVPVSAHPHGSILKRAVVDCQRVAPTP